jgi:RimJ/RimL family protein N-acetyltransferase
MTTIDPALVDTIETERLVMYKFTPDDAAFMLALVNSSGWLRFIGDRNVHSEEEARAYLERGPIGMELRTGYRQYKVTRKSDGACMGHCGLLKRDTLPDVDLGFAFLDGYGKQGYAREAASAVMDVGKRVYGLTRIVGITLADNGPSIRVLESVGMTREGVAEPAKPERNEAELLLYGWTAPEHVGR